MEINLLKAAQERIRPYVTRTPLSKSETLTESVGAPIYVKYELFQKTGSFKARGAFNKMLQLSDEQIRAGVVAVSGGNHAQAVGYSSSVLGVDATIVMPSNTPANYVDATRGYGAKVVLKASIAEAFDEASRLQKQGWTFFHPFDDQDIMAGQGTVGLEIVEDLPSVTDVIVSIGGGGLAGGVSTAIKKLKPECRIWGVETIGADAMSQALAAGRPVELSAITSIAKTLGAPYVSDLTLALAQQYLEGVTVISDSDAVRALFFIAERLKVITEPAASCTLAAAQKLSDKFDQNSKVVLILCGGNTSIADICSYRALLDQ
jgi:threonine dehydratase